MRLLGDSVTDASAVLTDLRKRLQLVGEALGSWVSGRVELAPVPSRVEERARAIDVLVSAPRGAQMCVAPGQAALQHALQTVVPSG